MSAATASSLAQVLATSPGLDMQHPAWAHLTSGDYAAQMTKSPLEQPDSLGMYGLRSYARSEDDASSAHGSSVNNDASSWATASEYLAHPLDDNSHDEHEHLVSDVANMLARASQAGSSVASDAISHHSSALASWTQMQAPSFSSDDVHVRGPDSPLRTSRALPPPPATTPSQPIAVPEAAPVHASFDLDETPHATGSFPPAEFPLGSDPLSLLAGDRDDSNMASQYEGPFAGHFPVPHAIVPAHTTSFPMPGRSMTDWSYDFQYGPPTQGSLDWAPLTPVAESSRRASYPPPLLPVKPPQPHPHTHRPPPQPLVAANPIYLSSTTPGRTGRRGTGAAQAVKEPLHWQSQTTAATKQAAIARRKPGVEARFACQYCGESFTRAYNLRGHLRAHQGERPFVCEVPGCGKAFARSHDRRRHQDLHSSACKYRCDQCDRPFRRLDALNRHIKQEADTVCSPMADVSGKCFAHSVGHCVLAVASSEEGGEQVEATL